jgi:hypothetical protein
METEGQRATANSYPTPIQPDIDSTHHNYNYAMSFLMDSIPSKRSYRQFVLEILSQHCSCRSQICSYSVAIESPVQSGGVIYYKDDDNSIIY